MYPVKALLYEKLERACGFNVLYVERAERRWPDLHNLSGLIRVKLIMELQNDGI